MQADQFIEAVNAAKAAKWKNSDISEEDQLSLEIIASHYEGCQECRQGFDDMEYEEMTLLELVSRWSDPLVSVDWTCQEA